MRSGERPPNLAHNSPQTAGKRSSRETEVQLKVRGAEGGTLRTQSYERRLAVGCVCVWRAGSISEGLGPAWPRPFQPVVALHVFACGSVVRVHGVGSALGESGVKELRPFT